MWTAIEYSDKYLDEMIDMIRENYGDIEIAHKDFLEWQYFKNPAGEAVIMLAHDEENEELAGQYIVIPFDIKINNQIVRCINSLDTLTRKSYRGLGIFKGLTEINYQACKDKGYGGVVIFPNENSRPGFYKYFPFKRLCRFPILVSTSFRFKIRRDIDCSYSFTEITNKNISILDDFWDRNKDKYTNIIGVRNSQYMRWRYLEIPHRDYGFFGVLKEGKLIGYIIGTIKKISGLKSGVIVDFFVEKGMDKNVVKALLNELFFFFRQNKAINVMAYLPRHSEEYELLKKNMFLRWPTRLEPRIFEVAALDFGEQILLKDNEPNEKQWFTTIGDFLLV